MPVTPAQISVWFCLSQFGLLQQTTIDWGAFKQEKCISHNSGSWKSKIKAPADSVSAEDLLSGSETAVISVCVSSLGGRGEGTLWAPVLFLKPLPNDLN